MKKNILYFIFVLLFFSCLKKEKPLPPIQPGDINTVAVKIGYPYLNQVFYNCNTNTVVGSNSRYSWDLGFESNGNHIKLNIGRSIFVANMGAVNFNSVTSINNPTWLWDNANGNLDSLALNTWITTSNTGVLYSNNVYVINRSYDNNGNHLGYYKIIFQHVNATSFTFKYAKLDGTEENTFTLLKNSTLNFTSFSFNNGGEVVNIEPNKNDWHLCFTNLQHKFSNLPLPFVLTQCVSNIYNGVTVAEVNNSKFTAITLADTGNFVYTSIYDEIGYDWKIRNSQDNSYTITSNKYFIIRTKEGFYYKMRFIDFYNNIGVKGYPKFEIQKL